MFATQPSTSAAQTASSQRTLTQYYPFVRLSQYIAKFKADPLALSNIHLMRYECEWVNHGAGHVLARKRDSLADDVRPAELRIIGEISRESYWLNPCGGWSGAFGEPLDKAKATGRLSAGRLPDLAGLWPLFLDNLDTIVFSRGPPLNMRQFPLVDRGCLKIRHKIFEPIPISARRSLALDQAVYQAMSSRLGNSVQMSALAETLESTAHVKVEEVKVEEVKVEEVKVEEELEVKTEARDVIVPSDPQDTESFVDLAYEIDALDSSLGQGLSLSHFTNIDESDIDSVSTISDSDIGDATTVVNAPTDDGLSDSSEDSSGDELPDAFAMRNWPCRTDYIRRELHKLISSKKFVGKPLPVFDLDGNRIPPIDHEKKLKGALVDVSFTVTNVTYRQDSFFADIKSIIILAPPGYEPQVEKPKTTRVKSKYPVPKHLKEFNSTAY